MAVTTENFDWIKLMVKFNRLNGLFNELNFDSQAVFKTDFGYLKEWESSLSDLSKQILSKSIPWDFLREILPLLCDHHFCKAFQIKKPPRTWIFEVSLKWGSCYFGSGPKLSLLHLIFILCNLFYVEALCYLLWSCWSVICLLFSITGFVIELVQWVLHWSRICWRVQ